MNAVAFDDGTCRVVYNDKLEIYTTYRYDVLPTIVLNSDGTQNRFGKRFAVKQTAQAEFRNIKTSTQSIVHLNSSEL